MPIEEIREIREKQSLEAAHLTGEALREYFAKGARELQEKIDALRNEKVIIKQEKKIAI